MRTEALPASRFLRHASSVVHRCYACDATNADAIFDGAIARVPARFAGPIGLANGGIAAGMLACPARREADDGARVTRIVARLSAGVPLERALAVEASRGNGGAAAVTLRDGDAMLVTATAEVQAPHAAPDAAPVAIDAELTPDLAAMASIAVPDAPPFYALTGEHPIPGCFSCGPAHPAGLGIIPRFAGDGVVASAWAPAGRFDDGDGTLPAMIVASALDCSSGICMPVADQRALLAEDRFFLLGSLDVRFLRAAPADAAYRVVARSQRRDGRKHYGRSALIGDDDVVYAMADALWLVAPVTRGEAFA